MKTLVRQFQHLILLMQALSTLPSSLYLKAFGGNQLRLLQYLLPYQSLQLDVVTLNSSLLHTLRRPLLVHSVLTLSLDGSLVPPLSRSMEALSSLSMHGFFGLI